MLMPLVHGVDTSLTPFGTPRGVLPACRPTRQEAGAGERSEWRGRDAMESPHRVKLGRLPLPAAAIAAIHSDDVATLHPAGRATPLCDGATRHTAGRGRALSYSPAGV